MVTRGSVVRSDERLIVSASNSTFHRSFSQDYVIAVSDRAVYLPTRWKPFRRPSCIRIALQDIQSITLSEPHPNRFVALLWFVPILPILVALRPWAGTELDLRNFELENGLLSAFLASLVGLNASALRGRSALIVRAREGEHRFVTPPDPYVDEKAHDRRALREALAACQSLGIAQCQDETAASTG